MINYLKKLVLIRLFSDLVKEAEYNTKIHEMKRKYLIIINTLLLLNLMCTKNPHV